MKKHQPSRLVVSPFYGPAAVTRFEEMGQPELPDVEGKSLEDLRGLLESTEEQFRVKYDEYTGEGKVASQTELDELEAIGRSIDVVLAAVQESEADERQRAEAAEDLHSRYAAKTELEEPDAEEDVSESAEEVELESQREAESLAASGQRERTSFSGAARKRGNADRVPVQPEVHQGYVMAPSLPKHRTGFVTSFDLARAADELHANSVVRGLRSDPSGKAQHLMSLGSLSRQFPENLFARDEASLTAALEVATDEKRLPGASLTAAAGWCSPSQVVYDFLAIPDAQDLYDMPEIAVERGGIRYPVQPDFGRAFTDQSFLYTEAELLALEDDKPCFEVPCPGFEELRLGAVGLCITAGILQQRGYPEAVQAYIDGLLVAHQHRISSWSIETVRAGSTSVAIPANTVLGAYGALLNSIEIAVVDIQTRNRLPSSTTIEVVLPVYARAILRADLAYRRGVNLEAVTDAQLSAHFTLRKANVQYVSDYQTGDTGQPGVDPGVDGSTAFVQWPDEIEFLAYPAGTWFRSLQDVIEVGNLYDQAQLKQNKFTALFTEDAIGIGKRGIDSRKYTVPLAVNGAVGPAIDLSATGTGG